MNVRTFRREKPLLFPAEIHIGFRHGHARHRAHLGINLDQQVQILFNRNCERVDLERRSPIRNMGLLRSKLYIVLFHPRGRLGDLHGPRRGGFHAGTAQIVRRRKAPGSIDDYAYANTERL